jgi:hypothetical protein
MEGKEERGKKGKEQVAGKKKYDEIHEETVYGVNGEIGQMVANRVEPPPPVIQHVRKGDHWTVIPNLPLFLGTVEEILGECNRKVIPILDIVVLDNQFLIIPDELSLERVVVDPGRYYEKKNRNEVMPQRSSLLHRFFIPFFSQSLSCCHIFL